MIMERGFMNKEEIIKSAIILAVFLGKKVVLGTLKNKRKFLINVTIKENETNKKIE